MKPPVSESTEVATLTWPVIVVGAGGGSGSGVLGTT